MASTDSQPASSRCLEAVSPLMTGSGRASALRKELKSSMGFPNLNTVPQDHQKNQRQSDADDGSRERTSRISRVRMISPQNEMKKRKNHKKTAKQKKKKKKRSNFLQRLARPRAADSFWYLAASSPVLRAARYLATYWKNR